MLEPADPNFLGQLAPMRQTIQFMTHMLPTADIAVSLYVLKEGRAFSRTGEHRRPCLIAVIRAAGRPPLVLIEVDHSGGKTLSSLLLRYSDSVPLGTIELHVKTLLDGLIDNSGSWSTDHSHAFAPVCECIRLPCILRNPDQTDERSYKRYCLRWARQLIDRLGLEDLVADDRISA